MGVAGGSVKHSSIDNINRRCVDVKWLAFAESTQKFIEAAVMQLVVVSHSQHLKPWYEMAIYVQVKTSQERTEPTTKLL